MKKQNPRRGNGTGLAIRHGDDCQGCNKTRPILQGNDAMRLRLSALIWASGLRDAAMLNHLFTWGDRI